MATVGTPARSRPWRRLLKAATPRPVLGALDRYRVHQVVACARLTTQPARFAAREFRGGGRLARYRLRSAPFSFCLHHGSEDLGVLDEIFRLRHYAIPSRVEQRLRQIDEPLRVADLGAHVGLFGIWVLSQFPTARLVAFEPDAANHRALTCSIHANRCERQWRSLRAAASTRDEQVRFSGGRSSGSRMVVDDGGSSADGSVVPALDVFGELQGTDLLKMDMEGGEWAVLHDPRLRALRPPVVVLEYHPHLCPSSDPRAAAHSVLAELGYTTETIFDDLRSGVGMLWALRDP